LISEQFVSINNDLIVARRAVEMVVGIYPNGGFWRGLMTPRAEYFDALIVEKIFRHNTTIGAAGTFPKSARRSPHVLFHPQVRRLSFSIDRAMAVGGEHRDGHPAFR
jgi:hypothetical protein